MRIVFMGTPEFSIAALEKLISSEHEIPAVYTQPDKPGKRGRTPIASPVKKVALDNGLVVLQPASLKAADTVGQLADLQPNLIVVVAFGQILTNQILAIPEFGCINIHPSLLPKYRGASPVASAILNDEKETGVTLMLMDEGVDTGPVLVQKKIVVGCDDTTQSLEAELSEIGAALLIESLPVWFSRRIQPRSQNEKEATYTKQVAKEDGRINWQSSAQEIGRRIRAFFPWPGTFTQWQGRTFKILEATPLINERLVEYGAVISLESEAGMPAGVGTGNGVLGLKQVQLEGKKAMTMTEFLRGHQDFIGQKLGD